MPKHFLSPSGAIYHIRDACEYLLRFGTVYLHDCPLTYSLLYGRYGEAVTYGVPRFYPRDVVVHNLREYIMIDGEFGSSMFEDVLMELVRRNPVTARIPMCSSYAEAVDNGRIYDPSEAEVAFIENNGGCGHYMLLTARDRDRRDGTPFWEFQDSYGEERGFVRVRCGRNLITHFIDIVVL